MYRTSGFMYEAPAFGDLGFRGVGRGLGFRVCVKWQTGRATCTAISEAQLFAKGLPGGV